MASFIVCLLVVIAVAYRVTTPEDRARYFRLALERAGYLKHAVEQARQQPDPFHEALCTRTPRVFVTPALLALNAAFYVWMVVGPGSPSDADTLIAWGGSVGPRTTNGEWWRLLTTMFVHGGLAALLVSMAGLAQVGLLLERLVGPVAFGAVYLAAGVLASLVSLSAQPLAVSAGASGAVSGVYGLFLATLVIGLVQRSPLAVPLVTLKRLAPAAAVFVLYTSATGGLAGGAESTGLVAGIVFGLGLAIGTGPSKPPLRRVATALGAAAVAVVALAVPLGGMADVRPELERLVAIEERTAADYQVEVGRFRKNQIRAEALVHLIDATIVPELQAARARLVAIERVPPEHQPLVAGADDYFRLREKSWRLRAEGLRETNMRKLQEAGVAEQASLEALQKVKPAARD